MKLANSLLRCTNIQSLAATLCSVLLLSSSLAVANDHVDASATQIPPSLDASATQIPPSDKRPQMVAGLEQPGAGQIKWPKAVSPVKKDPAMEAKIVEIMADMTLEEKVGQMIQPEIRYSSPQDAKKYHFGSVLSGGGSFPKGKGDNVIDWVALNDRYYMESIAKPKKRAAIPIVWGIDAVHGHNNVRGATLFPHNIGLGAARNPDLIQAIGEVTAREVTVTGMRWTFAPTVAVARDERWGRTYESYSEDPKLVAEYGFRMVLGLQGVPGTPGFFGPDKVIATAKHFVGDGGTTGGVDQGDVSISEKELFEIHAQGYYSAIEAGVQSIMASFNSWNAYEVHGSKYIINDVLKEQMGFDGLVVGDWNGHGYVPGCMNGSCAQAVNAGIDLMMVPEAWLDFYKNTLRQVNSGEISMERVDDAVTRILRVKMRAGLFDPEGDPEALRPSKLKFAGQEFVIGHERHRSVAAQAVRESLVLLKNDGDVLPVQPKQKIFVTGSHADDIANQSGGWSVTWQGTENTNADFPGATSVFAGLKEDAKAVASSIELGSGSRYKKKPDVAIVVFGETPYAEFDGDQDDLAFKGAAKNLALIQKLKADGIKVVSVFMSGRPMAINEIIDASDAFVAAWLPGTEGYGVSDVLMADKDGNPQNDFKGKLSFSWPRHKDQVPMNVGDEEYDPLYPYGFGLTYAD